MSLGAESKEGAIWGSRALYPKKVGSSSAKGGSTTGVANGHLWLGIRSRAHPEGTENRPESSVPSKRNRKVKKVNRETEIE
jgi:hypothetical protein